MEDKDQIDKLLNQKLGGMELELPEGAFEKIAGRRKKKKRFGFWLLSGLAAALFLVLGIGTWLTNTTTTKETTSNKESLNETPLPEAVLKTQTSTNPITVKARVTEAHRDNVKQKTKVAKSLKVDKTENTSAKPIKQKENANPIKPITEKQTIIPAERTMAKEEINAPLFNTSGTNVFDKIVSSTKDSNGTSVAESKCETISDSVISSYSANPVKKAQQWFIEASSAVWLFNSQQVYNSQSVLVFGDSTHNYDDPELSYSLGMGFGYYFHKSWGIGSGLYLQKTRFASITPEEQFEMNENASTAGLDPSTLSSNARYFDESVTYLQVPVYGLYKVNKNKWEYVLSAGPELHWLWRTQSFVANPDPGSAPESVNDASNARLNRLQAGAYLGLGMGYKLGKHWVWNANLGYRRQFKGIMHADYGGSVGAGMLGIGTGIKFYF